MFIHLKHGRTDYLSHKTHHLLVKKIITLDTCFFKKFIKKTYGRAVLATLLLILIYVQK